MQLIISPINVNGYWEVESWGQDLVQSLGSIHLIVYLQTCVLSFFN